jgi:NhaP-type Na+/H+ or K+/H+ antiporter
LIAEIAVLAVLAGFALLAGRFASTPVTAPIVFLATGVAASLLGLVPAAATEPALHVVAEVALVLLLFLDAAKVDARALWRHHTWPARMLAIGLPASFLVGWGAAIVLLPGWPVALTALAAALLLPTDAALGQTVVNDPDVPTRARRTLTVESGLNDGLALPLVLVTSALAAPVATAPEAGWLLFAAQQIVLGVGVGAAVGAAGGAAMVRAQATGATSEVYEGIATLALAGLAYFVAGAVGGNGFLAAFAGGLGFGGVLRGRCAFVYEFTESEGQLVAWTAFFLLGALLVPEAAAHLTLPVLTVIVTSFLVVRPLAVWIALNGTDATPVDRLFFGWFGPRGLATAIFALIVMRRLDLAAADQVVHLAINAVWISALLHGASAVPGGRAYARYVRGRDGSGGAPSAREANRR